jgi:hypothetical protein
VEENNCKPKLKEQVSQRIRNLHPHKLFDGRREWLLFIGVSCAFLVFPSVPETLGMVFGFEGILNLLQIINGRIEIQRDIKFKKPPKDTVELTGSKQN